LGWTLFFMMVILKIPLIAALWLIWYAVKEPVEEEGPSTGEERRPYRRPPSAPRFPRRGPGGGAGCPPPPCPQLAEPAISRAAPLHARRG
jgi:hypothetical protein